MAKNTRLILKSINNEIFSVKDYKLYPGTINNILFASMNDAEKAANNYQVSAFYIDGALRNISELNNLPLFNRVNGLRNPLISFENITPVQSLYLESVPKHYHISETIANMERMQTEYPRKFNALGNLSTNLFDSNYASQMWMVGRASQITPINNRISSSSVLISGYIKVENASANLRMNMVFRGVPVPMRRTETSSLSTGRKNYIFTYPQYLVDNIELVQSIQYIELENYDVDTLIYYGTNYEFTLSDLIGYETSANLNIINKESRNLTVTQSALNI
jgi:hypothetical protein